ncbi:STAS domain-containing protein [Kitasatospora phosalacinea]|uniref:Anti-sigma factor antagonist n=1 Tax=Kitasatospora phosalacinea TaxID=2065 RepID=A0A9W6PHU8_9ACTN|nr:STAS domain-containing protein [Kitasatospora phosalacinea]GLW55126.1 anti-sigma factor antagonist [Kitasatospora phosalacinea]
MTTASIDFGQSNGWSTVALHGSLAPRDVAVVRDRLLRLVAAGCRHLVLDLSGLERCDAAGFAVLIATRRHLASRGGELRLVLPAPGTPVRSALSAFGAHQVFDIHPTAEAAASDARPAAPLQRRATAREHGARASVLGAIPRQRG